MKLRNENRTMEQEKRHRKYQTSLSVNSGECVSAPQGAFERIGLKPEIHPSTLEENPLCTEPAQVVMELAGQKARAM